MDHPNARLMQESYEALQRGDVAVLESSATDAFTFDVSGTSAISGTVHSPTAAMAEFGRAMELTGGDMAMQPVHVLADDRVGIVVLEVRASRPDGRRIEQRVIHEWRFRDGRVDGIREWVWDQAADVAFWS